MGPCRGSLVQALCHARGFGKEAVGKQSRQRKTATSNQKN